MRLFKSGKDLSKIAESINVLNLMIKDNIPQIENIYKCSSFMEDILLFVFTGRKSVIDLIEEIN